MKTNGTCNIVMKNRYLWLSIINIASFKTISEYLSHTRTLKIKSEDEF